MSYAQKPPPPNSEIIVLACLAIMAILIIGECVEAYRWYTIWSELFK